MYKCKYFKIAELVTPTLYNNYGEACWSLLDERALKTIDKLREIFGPCTINDYSWGGSFQYSGIRDEHYYSSTSAYLSSRSQHKYGRAFDLKFRDHTAQEVRKYIIEHKDEFDITFLETGPLSDGSPMSWVHIDVRNGDFSCWSPKEGYLSEDEVISRKL